MIIYIVRSEFTIIINYFQDCSVVYDLYQANMQRGLGFDCVSLLIGEKTFGFGQHKLSRALYLSF